MLQKTKKSLAFWIVAVPMFLAIVYYTVFAASRYVSESIVAVRQSGDTGAAAASGIAMLLTGINPASNEETLYLKEYIHSLDMLKYLDGKLGLRKAYEAETLDLPYRLYPGTSQEWFLWYYRNRVETRFDDTTGLLTVRVEGFDADFSRALNAEILAQGERFVNEISHRMARDQMAFAEGELRTARERLQAAKSRLIAFQNKHKMLDPLAQAQATATLTTELQSEITRKETELKTLQGYLQEDAHQVVAVRNELAALRAQFGKEQDKVASGNGSRLNTLAAEFQNLTLEAGFAEDAYKATLSAVETTRIEVARKLKNLVVIESPAKPEVAIYPQRLYNLLTMLVALTLLYGIVRLVIATIQDHRD